MENAKSWSAVARRDEPLAGEFGIVSSYFLANYTRLGVSNTEAILLVHLMDITSDGQASFPSTGTLAQRMGITPRQIRAKVCKLEKRQLVRRIVRHGQANGYDLTHLFKALRALMAESSVEDRDRENPPWKC